MALDFSHVKEWYIPVNGVNKKVKTVNINGVDVWKFEDTPSSDAKVAFMVERYVTNTYSNSTTYTDDAFISLSIRTPAGGVSTITYDGATTTYDNSSGSSALTSTFRVGKYAGVDDGTLASGLLEINGDCDGFAQGSFSLEKSTMDYCGCITKVINMPTNFIYLPHAFENCKKLQYIPISKTNWSGSDVYSFANNCESLKEIFVPDARYFSSANYSLNICFKNCGSLEKISVDPNNSNVFDFGTNVICQTINSGASILKGCKNTDFSKISSSYNRIEEYAFSKAKGIVNLVLPDFITHIYSYAFKDCPDLRTITLSKTMTVSSGYLGQAFMGTNLNSIVVDAENTTLDSRDNCNAIIQTSNNIMYRGCKNTTIPSTVTQIGYSAFSGCIGLVSMNVPSNITSIGLYAFTECPDLTTISFAEGFTTIGEYAFNSCKKLTSVSLPASLTKITQYAFKGCSTLTAINYAGTTTQWESVTKGTSWAATGTIIHCSDGDVTV